MLAMIVKLVHAIALVTLSLAVFCNAQRVIPVAVGREGNELKLRFSPEEIFASVGDMIQFQFYPVVSTFPLLHLLLVIGYFFPFFSFFGLKPEHSYIGWIITENTLAITEPFSSASGLLRSMRADKEQDRARVLLWLPAFAS